MVAHLLVFYSATYGHIFISIAPIWWNAQRHAFYAFGNEKEVQVASQAYHFPCGRSPFIGCIEKKIGTEACIYQ